MKYAFILAEKANLSTGPVTVLIPLGGVSMISEPGKPFHDAKADAALFSALRKNLRPDIEVVEVNSPINAPAFAEACARALLGHLKNKSVQALA